LRTISLIAGTEMSRQAITKHLRALQEVGIVRGNRVGRDRVWQLRTRRLAEIRRYLEEISAQWDATLARLHAFVEEE
jgi:DNA-binding transcriptional ArsR family regulator